MAKKSISITLEEETIEMLRDMADNELRSVSNLIEYISIQYALINNEMYYEKIKKANDFASKVRIVNFKEMNDNLSKNVHIDEADLEYIAHKRNDSK